MDMTYRTARAPNVFLALIFLAAFAAPMRAEAPAPSTAPAVSAQTEKPFPIPIIELDGTGLEIGRKHADALRDKIRDLHTRYLTAYFHNSGAMALALAAASMFEPKFAPEHRDEVQALATATSIDPRQMLLAQCFLDLRPGTACSTVALPASASPDGVARFGRNLDFRSFDVADKASVLLVYRPEGRYQFVSIAWPGMMGVLSGMNEHGLSLANMEVKRGGRLPSAMPYTLLYRTVLERCRTVDEAVALLRDTARQSANNLMLMDADGNRAAVEITPDGIAVRKGHDDAALISTNHQRGEDYDSQGKCVRYDLLRTKSQQQFGKIDEAGVKAMLSEVAQGKYTMQSMVFEPSNRVLILSTGQSATKGAYHRLDLKPYFKAKAAG